MLHTVDMGTMQWGTMVPDTAERWVMAALQLPLRMSLACQRLLRTVPPMAPRQALTWDVWRTFPDNPIDRLVASGTRCPACPILEQLTAPTLGNWHALQQMSATTGGAALQTVEALDLALEPLWLLLQQAHIPQAGISNQLA